MAYMDYLAPSGFGNVSKNVIDRLDAWLEKNDIRLDICATNFGTRDKVVVSERITAYNARLFAQNMNDMWYRDGFLKLLNDRTLDLILGYEPTFTGIFAFPIASVALVVIILM